MKTIYLVDYIGNHCGMHYYLQAFKDTLQQIDNIEVSILSNYTTNGTKPFFLNQYEGNSINKVFSLIKNFYRLRQFIGLHPNDTIVYLTYGNIIDIPFIKLVSSLPFHVIDIHEAIAQNVDSKKRLKSKFEKIYKKFVKTVISHSSRTNDFLKEYGFNGRCFQVPHFKYRISKEYNISNISPDIQDSIDKQRINVLFFGNLNESKGIDILIDSVNKLPDSIAEKINLIIAGKDFDGTIDKITPIAGRHVHIFRKHISDDELRFLYQNVDYLSLPYRKTSQSGILEMALYFKRPIIVTDIPYFRKTLQEFQSFGVLSGNDSKSYAETLVKVINNHNSLNFFSENDYERYENRKEIELFKKELNHWISQMR